MEQLIDISPILHSMRAHPEDWHERDECVLTNKEAGVEVWTFLRHYRLYKVDGKQSEIEFTFWQRRRFHRAYLRWKKTYWRLVEKSRADDMNSSFAARFRKPDIMPNELAYYKAITENS